MSKLKNIIVLGGGASVEGFPYQEINDFGCYVIGVNDAFRYAPVDCVVSMDRLFLEGRWEELKAFGEAGKSVYLRENAYRVNKKPETFPNLQIFDCNHMTDKMDETTTFTLNGRSSGHCAINLAYKMRPDNVYLFGFDMQGGHWWPPYPWAKEPTGQRSDEWINAFRLIERYFGKSKTNIYVCGKSAIRNLPKISFEEFVTMREKCAK